MCKFLWILVSSIFLMADESLAYQAVSDPLRSHSIITAGVIHPGSEFSIRLELYNLTSPFVGDTTDNSEFNCTLTIEASIEELVNHRSIWPLQLHGSSKSFSKQLKFMIPRNVDISKTTYNFKLESDTCFIFKYSSLLPVRRQKLHITITPDKRRYKHGDMLGFNVIVLYPDASPYLGSVYIAVLKGKNIYTEWPNEVPEKGMIRKEMLIPAFLPVPATNLTILVRVQDQNESTTVYIDLNHENKQFQANLNVPRFYQWSEDNLIVHLLASQHSGLPVEGMFQVEVKLNDSMKQFTSQTLKLHKGYGRLPIELATLKSRLDLPNNETLLNKTIEVVATVKDSRNPSLWNNSIHSVTKSQLLTFIDFPYEFKVHDLTSGYFRPGYFFNYFLQMKPMSGQPLTYPVDISVTVGHSSANQTLNFLHDPRQVQLTSEDVHQFSHFSHDDDTGLHVEASVSKNGVSKRVQFEVERFHANSSSGMTIRVDLSSEQLRVTGNEELKAVLFSSEHFDKAFYEVFSQGLLLTSGVIPGSKATSSERFRMKHSSNFSVTIPRNSTRFMTTCWLLVWTVSPKHEIVADSLMFTADHNNEKVMIENCPKLASPGESIYPVIRTEPNSDVYLVVNSEFVVFEENQQIIRQQVALNKMKHWTTKLKYGNIPNIVPIFADSTTIFSRAPTPAQVFKEAEGLIFTDVEIKDSHPPKNLSSKHEDTFNLPPYDHFDSLVWYRGKADSSGLATFNLKLSAESKFYTMSAVAANHGSGLSFSTPLQVVTTAKVHVALKCPSEIVEGESFMLEVQLFHEQTHALDIDINVKGSSDYQVTCAEDDREKQGGSQRHVKIASSVVVTELFQVKPTTNKMISIDVEVQHDNDSQLSSCNMTVNSKGLKIQSASTFVLSKHDDISINNNTESVTLKIYGDPLGPSLEYTCWNLETLSFLNDRTKIKFISAAYSLKHVAGNGLFRDVDDVITSVGGAGENKMDKEECIQNILHYLQYRMNKVNPDWSYSFYPPSEGFVWYTSMMVEVMIDLRDQFPQYESSIVRSVEWLLRRQEEDGSFVEAEDALYLNEDKKDMAREMKHLPLTSKVLISLVKAKSFVGSGQLCANLDRVISKSAAFIERNFNTSTENSYVLSIATHALMRAGKEIHRGLKRLNEMSFEEGSMLYWAVGEREDISSLSIEATSYMALTHLSMGDLHSSRPIINWLIGQMRKDGIFVASEDTLVALQAMTKYLEMEYQLYQHTRVDDDVVVTWSEESRVSFRINNPFFVGSVVVNPLNVGQGNSMKVRSTGSRFVLAQMITDQSTSIPSDDSELIQLSVEVSRQELDLLQVNISVVWKDVRSSGFVVVEVPLLSGYEFNPGNVANSVDLQMHQLGRTVYVMLHEVKQSKPQFVNLQLEKVFNVLHGQPQPIRAYSIHDPSNQAIQPYNFLPLDSETLP